MAQQNQNVDKTDQGNLTASLGTIVLDASDFEDLEQVVANDNFLRSNTQKQHDLVTGLQFSEQTGTQFLHAKTIDVSVIRKMQNEDNKAEQQSTQNQSKAAQPSNSRGGAISPSNKSRNAPSHATQTPRVEPSPVGGMEPKDRVQQSATARKSQTSPPGVSKQNIFTDSPRRNEEKGSSASTPSGHKKELKAILNENTRKDLRRPSIDMSNHKEDVELKESSFVKIRDNVCCCFRSRARTIPEEMQEIPQEDYQTARNDSNDIDRLAAFPSHAEAPSLTKGITVWWKKLTKKETKGKLKFKDMNSDERKVRIAYLWGVIRSMANAKSSVKRLQCLTVISAEEKMIINLGLDINDEDDFDQIKVAKFKHNNKIRQAWELMMTIPMWYSMITVPILILWPEYNESYLLGSWVTDILWLIDLGFNFFKANNEIDISFTDTALTYFSGAFIFDILATLPALFSYQDIGVVSLKMCRIVNFDYFTRPFDMILTYFVPEKYMETNYRRLSSYLLGTMLFAHFLSISWLAVGDKYHSHFANPWMQANEEFLEASHVTKYVFAYYWITETITTVGYGDYTGTTTAEMGLSLMYEFIGLSVMFGFMSVVARAFKGKVDFDVFIAQKFEGIDKWMKTLEKSNAPYYIHSNLFQTMRVTIEEAFEYDFNTLIEEEQYNFYVQLTPADQTKVVGQLFGYFIEDFAIFFDKSDTHFINMMITNMLCRMYNSYEDILKHSVKVNEISLIVEGRVVLRYKDKQEESFHVLNKNSWFGEYECMFEEKSDFTYTAVGDDSNILVDMSTNPARSMMGSILNKDNNGSGQQAKKKKVDKNNNGDRVKCMCVHEDAFAECCQFWPKAKEIFYKRSIKRHEQFILMAKQHRENKGDKERNLAFELSVDQLEDDSQETTSEILNKLKNGEDRTVREITLGPPGKQFTIKSSVPFGKPSLFEDEEEDPDEEVNQTIGQIDKKVNVMMTALTQTWEECQEEDLLKWQQLNWEYKARKDQGLDADLKKMTADELYQALSAKFNAKGQRALIAENKRKNEGGMTGLKKAISSKVLDKFEEMENRNIPIVQQVGLDKACSRGNQMAIAIKNRLQLNFKQNPYISKRPDAHKRHRRWPSLKSTLNSYSKKLCREYEKSNIEELVDDLIIKGKIEKSEDQSQSQSNPQGDEEEELSLDLGPTVDFQDLQMAGRRRTWYAVLPNKAMVEESKMDELERKSVIQQLPRKVSQLDFNPEGTQALDEFRTTHYDQPQFQASPDLKLKLKDQFDKYETEK